MLTPADIPGIHLSQPFYACSQVGAFMHRDKCIYHLVEKEAYREVSLLLIKHGGEA